MSINLLQGDCLEILKTIPDHSIDMLITDPPYAVLKTRPRRCLTNETCAWDNVDLIPFTTEWWNLLKPKMKDNTFAFIFWSQKYVREGLNIFMPARMIHWQCRNLTSGGQGDFNYDYTPIFVIKFGKPRLIRGRHSCILDYPKPQSNFKKDKAIHPTQKPVALIEHLIHIACSGRVVLDIFGGSGTTGIAALHTNRDAIVIEKDLVYYQKAVQRLEKEYENNDTPIFLK